MASQVWIIGDPNSPMRPTLLAHFAVHHGAPTLHVSGVRLLGWLSVHGGEIRLTDCSIAEAHSSSDAGGVRRHLSAAQVARGLSIVGGDAFLARVELHDYSAGAILVDGGRLTLSECIVRDSRAPTGGAMLVRGGGHVTIILSNLTGNAADVSGGALQVRLRQNTPPPRSPPPLPTHTYTQG